MELILREDVLNLGFKDDLVKVKPGYGRNYLKKVLAENLKQRAFKEEKVINEAKALGEKLAAVEMKISSKVGTGDKLFGSVTAADVEAAFASQGHTVERKCISLPGRIIKRLGKYEASLRLHRVVVIQFPFEIVPDKSK